MCARAREGPVALIENLLKVTALVLPLEITYCIDRFPSKEPALSLLEVLHQPFEIAEVDTITERHGTGC